MWKGDRGREQQDSHRGGWKQQEEVGREDWCESLAPALNMEGLPHLEAAWLVLVQPGAGQDQQCKGSPEEEREGHSLPPPLLLLLHKMACHHSAGVQEGECPHPVGEECVSIGEEDEREKKEDLP